MTWDPGSATPGGAGGSVDDEFMGRVFSALADLAPARRQSDELVPGSAQLTFLPEWDAQLPRGGKSDRLAALDALHRDERILRRAWGIVHFAREDGKRARLPLVTQPVRLQRTLRGYRIQPAGDIELTGAIADSAAAERLESTLPPVFDGNDEQARSWLAEAAASAGFPDARIEGEPTASDETVVVAATALFTTQAASAPAVADHLRSWARRPGLAESSLRYLYGAGTAEAAEHDGSAERQEHVSSVLPLDPDQRTALLRARRDPISVVSGAPGCGKSHTLVAIALDAVAHGRTVLMATQTVHAAEVLNTLLSRQPGPSPVLFGDADKRGQLIDDLTSGAESGSPAEEVRAAESSADLADRTVRALLREITEQLELEAAAARAAVTDAAVLNDAPGLLEPGRDLGQAEELVQRARSTAGGWFARWRARRAGRRLRDMARSSLPVDEIALLLPVAKDLSAAGRLSAQGGCNLDQLWERLARAEESARTARGEALRKAATAKSRRDRDAVRAMAALGTALRAGRNRRRQMLADIDTEALLRALPLWIGTVTDIEDLLPQHAGMFDLVILDEASHIDQIRAAGVLARGRRAVIAGDPQQLRFVSFVADRDVTAVIDEHGLGGIADRLDVRRNSAFDLAAGATPVTMLHEHYRSVPHLIGFSSERFYRGRVSTATRHPRNHGVDAIDVHHVSGGPAVDGISEAELQATVELVAKLLDEGVRDLAVITPFRAQADRIEAELLAAYSADQIIDYRLRCGTVHSFQGSEANTVVVSLGVHRDDAPSRQRFAADKNLFNVLLTRARQKLHVVTALEAGEPGLIADFLDYAEHPPTPPRSSSVPQWAEDVAAELAAAGATVSTGYPVGRWTVDICLGDDADAVGLICGVHPDGPAAHVDRQRVLRQVGWRTRDVFPSRYAGNPTRAALDVLADFPHATGPSRSGQGDDKAHGR